MKKQYWFSIETYVHIALKKDALLLYNTLNGKTLEYSGQENREIYRLVKKLRSEENLQVTAVTKKEMQAPLIAGFVSDVRRHFMGELIPAAFSRGKPVQMMPKVTIEKNINRLKKEENRSVGEGIMEYLTEIFLYVNDECRQNCNMCSDAYRQFPCCTRNKNKRRELDIAGIKSLVEELKSTAIVNLNILGGNVFFYSKFKELAGMINHLRVQKTYYAHYLDIIDAGAQFIFLSPKSSFLKILIPFPINEEKFRTAVETAEKSWLTSAYTFVVQSEAEFEQAEALISVLGIENYDFMPYFNGENLDFFKAGVFPEKEEILAPKPQLKEIYTNSAVNSLDFGRLTVLSNGYIHANVNAPGLGSLGKHSLYDVLYKELNQGGSWNRTRKKVSPCRDCTFDDLCPPLSNYNHAIGRNDLCFKRL